MWSTRPHPPAPAAIVRTHSINLKLKDFGYDEESEAEEGIPEVPSDEEEPKKGDNVKDRMEIPSEEGSEEDEEDKRFLETHDDDVDCIAEGRSTNTEEHWDQCEREKEEKDNAYMLDKYSKGIKLEQEKAQRRAQQLKDMKEKRKQAIEAAAARVFPDFGSGSDLRKEYGNAIVDLVKSERSFGFKWNQPVSDDEIQEYVKCSVKCKADISIRIADHNRKKKNALIDYDRSESEGEEEVDELIRDVISPDRKLLKPFSQLPKGTMDDADLARMAWNPTSVPLKETKLSLTPIPSSSSSSSSSSTYSDPYAVGKQFTHNKMQYNVTHRGEDTPLTKNAKGKLTASATSISLKHMTTAINSVRGICGMETFFVSQYSKFHAPIELEQAMLIVSSKEDMDRVEALQNCDSADGTTKAIIPRVLYDDYLSKNKKEEQEEEEVKEKNKNRFNQ